MASKKRRGLFFVVNLGAMFVVAIVLVFLTLKGLDRYTRHGEAVLVPDVQGLSVQRAAGMFAANGLVYEVSDSTYVKEKPGGVILDCVPSSGSKVKEGRVIYVTINRVNTPLVVIPDVADNSSSRQARARILAAGFRLTEDEWIPGERDWVYAVKYNGRELELGEKVPSEALLTLVVGNGEDEITEDSLSVDDWETIDNGSISEAEDSWFE